MSVPDASSADHPLQTGGSESVPSDALPSRWRRFVRRFRQDRVAVAAACLLALMVVVTLAAPVIAPYDPSATDLLRTTEGPSAQHWLGTDDIGRDVLSRVLFGGRLSFQASLIAVAVALVIGLPLGLLSGTLGGFWDQVIMRANDTLMSFPALVLAITIVAFLGPGLVNAMVAVGVVFAPRFMRVIRGAALGVREEAYVEAARMMGASTVRVIYRHVLPNVLSPLFVQITIALGLAILAEASLSFLGLGVQPPEASWGAMLNRAFRYLDQAPVFALAPGVLIGLVVLAFNLVGDGIRDALGRETRTEG